MTVNEQLIARFRRVLGQTTAEHVVGALVSAGGDTNTATAVLTLYGELEDLSAKVARAAVEALPELQRRGCLGEIVRWLDLAVTLAEQSGATALKYCIESPLILSLISPSLRPEVLQMTLELADPDTGEFHVAVEFFKIAPELLEVLSADSPDRMLPWIDAGAELARCDYVLGIEFFRHAPAIARVLEPDEIRTWITFGMKLITENSLGKRDYLGTLEFFRTSPTLLGDIDAASVRNRVIGLGSLLADRSPALAIECLADAPTLLRHLPPAWRDTVLQYGMLVGERDAEAALAYFRRCPELLALIGNAEAATADRQSEAMEGFERWFRAGMDVLEYSPEGGRSYFSLQTRQALVSIEQAMSGVPLREVARTLKLFADALSGRDVTIQALDPITVASDAEPIRPKVSSDGRAIALPAILRRYPTREQNIRLYTVMTAHEAGHLEYGTYALSLDRLAALIAQVDVRYGRGQGRVSSLLNLFERYPHPRLAQDLWTLLEDARIEYRLQQDYPGLSRDLKLLARQAVTTRSLQHGLSVRELVVDRLLLLSTAEPNTVEIPEPIRQITESAWSQCQSILTPGATADEVVLAVDRIYVLLEQAIGTAISMGDVRSSDPDQGAGPQASEQLSGDYRPVTNWAWRGAMDPTVIRSDSGGGHTGSLSDAAMHVLDRTGMSQEPHREATDSTPSSAHAQTAERTGDGLTAGASPSSVVERLLCPAVDPRFDAAGQRANDRSYDYDEWDGGIRDYRQGWCRVRERLLPTSKTHVGSELRMKLGPSTRLLRRYFESLRPSDFRRRYGQMDGDDIDLNAAIQRRIELQAGAEPSDALYLHRQKRHRSVAAAFLVDLSGSTGRHLELAQQQPYSPGARRIIDIEREGLVLLGEALEAIGDQYGVYGYSGQGRKAVDLWVLKDFEEARPGQLFERIGGLEPLQQNRDGAAIRHVTRKLLQCDARIRLLVVLSDGRPLDDQYAGEYALEDTKMALREARQQGIDAFCITVDREADGYLRRMYGDVQFVVIDRAEALPQRLPRIYRRLTA